jgi:hypothetical protein
MSLAVESATSFRGRWLKMDFAQAVSREGYSKALCPCPLILEHEKDGIKTNFDGLSRGGDVLVVLVVLDGEKMILFQ